METQLKMDGTPSHGREVKVANPRSVRSSHLLLRILIIATTLIAAILMAFNKDTENIPIKLAPDLPPLYVPVTAKSYYLSAFKYFVVVNSMVCAYTALSLLSMVARAGKSPVAAWITVLDLIVLILLSTGVGAASAVGILGAFGNSHLQWQKVCNYYGKFCRQVAASIGVSSLGMGFFLVLIMLAILGAHRRP